MIKAQIEEKLVEYNKKAFGASQIGLLGGKMGSIMFASHLSKLTKDNSDWQNHLEEVFEDINSDDFEFPSFNYSVGMTGFCYAMNLLHKNQFIDFDPAENLEEFDDTLYTIGLKSIEEGYVDFLHQGVGVLHYFSQRDITPKIKNYLTDLTVAFLSNITSTEDAYYYPSTIGGMAGTASDLGLAHGLCGQLLILMNIHEKGILQEPISEALQKGLDFLLSRKESPTEERLSLYPTGVELETKKSIFYDRNAWCYGDINQALLFYRGHKILGDKKYLEEADIIGDAICQRTSYFNNVIDNNSHFCHGSSGMAQFYYSLYQATKQERYLEMYNLWIERTYNDFCKDLEKGIPGTTQYALLDGMGAAGMVLTSHVLDDDRNWSSIFLLS